jgi:hypothetical protein
VPVFATSSADSVKIVLTALYGSVEHVESTSPATPATCGVAIDVPLRLAYFGEVGKRVLR